MSDNTHIEWTDATWNPIRARYRTADGVGELLKRGWHCERISPGCVNCYAERMNRQRFGTGLPYNRTARDAVEIYLDEKGLTQPLHWRKPRRIFVCSMTDLFGEWVPDETIDRVFAVMALSPQHPFQVLTKRPERMREYVAASRQRIADAVRGFIDAPGRPRVRWLYGEDIAKSVEGSTWDEPGWPYGTAHGPMWPLPNVWLGVSVEDQAAADSRVPVLLDTPAAVRFLSCEPLLGPVQLTAIRDREYIVNGLSGAWERSLPEWEGEVESVPGGPHVDWVIVGGESGPNARPFDVAWARSIVAQCRTAGVAVFVKQIGSRPYEAATLGDGTESDTPTRWKPCHPKGGDPSEWPEYLRVREFPEVQR